MQQTISNFSRLIFLGVLMVLMVILFVGELLLINIEKTDKSKTKLAKSNNLVVLASSDGNSDENTQNLSSEIVYEDARPVIIRKYLEKYKSPLVPYADVIFQLSETYGFEYYWIVAIAQQESNLCKKIPENSFNCWGYGIHKRGTLRFENYELALRSYAEYLKREYFDKGLNTPELIMKKYCPSSNGSWARGVQQFIDELENGKF